MNIKGFSKVVGLGGYLPNRIIKSEMLMEEIGTEIQFGVRHDWLNTVVGIDERRVAADDEKPSDLAIYAAQIALQDAHLDSKDIDLVIYCGIDRDWCEPATAHRIQCELAPNAVCFDITNACHGFMDGIAVANSMIGLGAADTALIVTGEIPSRVSWEAIEKIKSSKNKADFKRWLGALTVGDSGAALVLSSNHEPDKGFQTFEFHSKGEYASLCYYTQGVSGIEGQMLMREIACEIVNLHRLHIDHTYKTLAWEPASVDKLITHQVGARPQQRLINAAGIDVARSTNTFTKLGNLISSTIPINLWLNRPQPNEKILILGTGSGLSISQSGMIF